MAREVIWTAAAWSDLEATADYVARDSTHYASAFVREVRDAARSLSHFAERGRVVPELGERSIRELFIGNFRLIYSVQRDATVLPALVHGGRDLQALWRREARSKKEQ